MEIAFEDKVRAGDKVARMIVEARLSILEVCLTGGKFPNGKKLTDADRSAHTEEIAVIRELLGMPKLGSSETPVQMSLFHGCERACWHCGRPTPGRVTSKKWPVHMVEAGWRQSHNRYNLAQDVVCPDCEPVAGSGIQRGDKKW